MPRFMLLIIAIGGILIGGGGVWLLTKSKGPAPAPVVVVDAATLVDPSYMAEPSGTQPVRSPSPANVAEAPARLGMGFKAANIYQVVTLPDYFGKGTLSDRAFRTDDGVPAHQFSGRYLTIIVEEDGRGEPSYIWARVENCDNTSDGTLWATGFRLYQWVHGKSPNKHSSWFQNALNEATGSGSITQQHGPSEWELKIVQRGRPCAFEMLARHQRAPYRAFSKR